MDYSFRIRLVLTIYGVAQSRTRLKQLSSSSSYLSFIGSSMEDLSWENSIKLMLSFGSFLAEFINSLDHSTSQGWDEQRIREKPELHLLIFFSRWVGNKSFGSVKKKQKNKNKNKKNSILYLPTALFRLHLILWIFQD